MTSPRAEIPGVADAASSYDASKDAVVTAPVVVDWNVGAPIRRALDRDPFEGFVAVTSPGSDAGTVKRHVLLVPERGNRTSRSTRVPVASFTKLWTAVATFRLVERGSLGLDDTVRDRIPELASRPWSTATLRELMTHTSAMPEFDEASGYFGDASVDPRDPVKAITLRVPSRRTEARGVFKYKNSEYALVGAMVSRAAGMPAHEALRTLVFGPAGMKDSGLLGTDAVAVDTSSLGHVRAANFFAAGAGYSTADDFLAFFEALSGSTLLGAESKTTLFDGSKARGWGAYGCWAMPFARDAGTATLVERQGALGTAKIFSAFFPESGEAVVAWTRRDVDFGHPYQGRGLGHRLTSVLGP
ncbi:MAG: serine hydrolase domain-containing protein [Polyangiaceae bacterium]